MAEQQRLARDLIAVHGNEAHGGRQGQCPTAALAGQLVLAKSWIRCSVSSSVNRRVS